ncbi:ABC transporter ATP-binding protein [Salinibacterium hongtaonis]|uniref:ABC transporter ATP-binding protein n=1 Tax=Homoserinimonas hongtaonis TaxID=2079791 RepID=UPI000D336B62|nr:ABC transporter ATP-binding protein [Salinibacterium hongtaonis]
MRPSAVVEAWGLSAQVSIGVDRRTLYDGVDLSVVDGESVAIVGRSGSGKTTLLSTLGLMQKPENGRLSIGGRDVSTLSQTAAARLRNELVGFVFQTYSLLPQLNVFENVAVPLRYGSRVKQLTIRSRVMSSLALVGLADRAKEKTTRLSGGEQQRVAIARALVREPKVVLADEPTGALDGDTANQVLDALQRATRHAGSCLIVVTHDPEVARVMDRAVQLHPNGLYPAKLGKG